MTRKLIPVAIVYDFDGTLSPGNIQEYEFVPAIKMTSRKFWDEVDKSSKDHGADPILAYMYLMLKKAQAANVKVQKEDFGKYGKSVALFDGVDDWFDRINIYAKSKGIRAEHFIISSGIREMIAGATIAKNFTAIFASSFMYDQHNVAVWPAIAINYTTKTQYLFRINKDALDVHDNKKINEFLPMEERPIPFKRMIFVGDGETDIPCFSLVKSQGGHSIAVYKPKTKGAKGKADKLVKDGRVNFVVPADYSDDSIIDTTVKAIIDKIASDCELDFLGKQE